MLLCRRDYPQVNDENRSPGKMQDSVSTIGSREQNAYPGSGGRRQIECREKTWDISHQQQEAQGRENVGYQQRAVMVEGKG